jgi:hypothetical protein
LPIRARTCLPPCRDVIEVLLRTLGRN